MRRRRRRRSRRTDDDGEGGDSDDDDDGGDDADSEDDEDEYEDSEETDDEIYGHLAGVDFRPAKDDQLLFDTNPQNQYQSPDLEPRRRSNLTCGSGDSREATEGGYGSTPSVGSFDDQNYQQQQR